MQYNTISLCPKCYMEIPAKIYREEHGVWMLKQCQTHGEFTGLVERDPLWFDFCKRENADNIYDGLLIDITSRCNIKCKYCFHATGKDNYTPDIIYEAIHNKDYAPFILTGGEPTLHPDLPEIVKEISKHGETILLTNGVKLHDEGYLDQLLKAGLSHDNTACIGLSFHKESMGKDFLLLDLLRKRNLMLGTSFYVVDDVQQIDTALNIYRDNQDVIQEIKIKAASNLWMEDKATNKIYVSDMLKHLSAIGHTEIVRGANNKISYANVIHEGLNVKLVSWYDKWNVDLIDINCPPYYRAKDGKLYNAATAFLKNHTHRGGAND